MDNNDQLLEHIKETAKKQVMGQDVIFTNLYLEKTRLKPGDIIYSGVDEIRIDRETIFVFADDEPLSNWGHPCRFQLFDTNTRDMYKEVNARFPPYLFHIPETYESFYSPVSFPADKLKTPDETVRVPVSTTDSLGEDNYSILFSGGSEKRHVNDLEYIYRKLTKHFGFSPDKIYVLNYDGTTAYSTPYSPDDYYPYPPNRYSMPVNAKGTRSELDSVIDELKGRLKSNDKLFLHTNNHGLGHEREVEPGKEPEESSLCLYTPKVGTLSLYYASDLASKLAELPKFQKLVVMMEQCHSGGFSDLILKNSPAAQTCFSSAAQFNKTSAAGINFNPFSSAWAEGITIDHYGYDNDSIRIATVNEALNHAKEISKTDIPVHKDFPEGCSVGMTLI